MKNSVLSAFSDLFSEKIQSLTLILEDTRKRAQAAPGSNVSHSDTSKFNISNLAVGIEAQLNLAREALVYLRTLRHSDSPGGMVAIGSLFTIVDIKNGKKLNFVLLIKGGGEKVQVCDAEIISITPGAPIARISISKKVGDELNFNGRVYRVIEIT